MNIDVIKRRVLASRKEADLLLDEFPNAAAAYSLRLLRTAYTGNCIQVRRSSDDALQNIGFVNGILDTASLLSFVGAGDGFVRTWYDQSGNGSNATQTTNLSQPQVVLNGLLNTFNNKVEINFDLNKLIVFNSTFIENLANSSVISVSRRFTNIGETAFLRIRQGTTNIIVIGYNNPNNNTGILHGGRRLTTDTFQAIGTLPFNPNDNLSFGTYKFSEAVLETFVNSQNNGVLNPFQTQGLTSSFGAGNHVIGAQTNQPNYNGSIKEIVIYRSDQSTNRTAIEQNINAYYNIF